MKTEIINNETTLIILLNSSMFENVEILSFGSILWVEAGLIQIRCNEFFSFGNISASSWYWLSAKHDMCKDLVTKPNQEEIDHYICLISLGT